MDAKEQIWPGYQGYTPNLFEKHPWDFWWSQKVRTSLTSVHLSVTVQWVAGTWFKIICVKIIRKSPKQIKKLIL